MGSNAPTPLHPMDSETLADADDERSAAFDQAEDRAKTPTPTRKRGTAFRLVEATPPIATMLWGSAAVLAGGALGYWLGARRSQQPARKVKRAASNVEHAVDLLPVAMQLLSNPMVRSLAIRLLMRRLQLAH